MKGIRIDLAEEVVPMPKDYACPSKENRVQSYAEKYYENQGFKVIRNAKYEILSVAKKRTPEIEENNLKIENFFKSIGKEKELEILKEVRKLRGENTVSGQPDIFAYRSEGDWFFAEVKSDKDGLGDSQKIVFALLKLILRCKVNEHLRLTRVTTKQNYEKKIFSFVVPLVAIDTEQTVVNKNIIM